MTDKFRFVILLLSVICLSMMMANVLTFNFCIICMTREVYDQRYITVNAGKGIFKHINLTLPEVDFIGAETRIEDDNIDDNDQSGDGDDWSNIPDISSVLGLNKVSARLLVENPQLFVKLMKKVLVEVSQLGITELGEAVDSRSVDMQQRIPEFFAGFNLSAFDKESLRGMKEIVCNLIHEGRITANSISDNITEWRNIDIEEFDLLNVTWDGDVYVRRDILVKKADKYYTHQQRSILFASVAVGALLAIAPISTSIHRYGARKTFTVVGSISAISTGLCPLAASFGVLPLTAMRILQGIGYAICMPLIGSITSGWACLSENGLFSGALTSFIQLGPVITMPISGIFCVTPLGWPAVFYFHAFVTAIVIAFWWTLYRDLPGSNIRVSSRELRKIREGKEFEGRLKHNRQEVPIKQICMNSSVWAVWIAAIGNMFSIHMVVVFAPIYLHQVLHYDILNVGIAAAMPTLVQFAVKMIAGCYSDKITTLSETQKVRIFNSIAFVGMALCLIALSFTSFYMLRYFSLFLLISSAAILGFNTGGFFKSSTLVARQFSHLVNAVVQVIMCLAMLTVPPIVFALTPEGTSSEWMVVFLIHAVLLLLCNSVFCFFGQGEAALFTSNQRLLNTIGVSSAAARAV